MTRSWPNLRNLSLAALALLGTASSAQTPPPPVQPTLIDTEQDRAQRMTVPVTIGGKGPYYFVVDTGADRTVVSRELANKLGLAAGAPAPLHSLTGVGIVQTVLLPTLRLAGRNTEDINAPALSEYHLGAPGLLGLDSLKDRRVVMDFRAQTLSVLEAGEKERYDPDTIVVTGRSRYGQLILVDADVDGRKITVIIDSGAQNTIGNSALRRMLGKRNKKLEFFKTTLIDVTGGRLAADVAVVNKVRIGGITIDDQVIAFADAHPFKRFDLLDRPAMLLGMDTLRGFDRVSVDFAQRKVRFLLPDEV